MAAATEMLKDCTMPCIGMDTCTSLRDRASADTPLHESEGGDTVGEREGGMNRGWKRGEGRRREDEDASGEIKRNL